MKRILIFFTFLFIIFSIYNYDIFFKSNPVKEIVTEGNSVYLDQKLNYILTEKRLYKNL